MMTLVQTSATYHPPKKSRSIEVIGEDGETTYTGRKAHNDIMDGDFEELNPQKAIDKVPKVKHTVGVQSLINDEIAPFSVW